ncbi:hypothetical protein J4430_03110 [Candidatus Woesearchaeota archaeon]|nr:hypothetical protein [Candidatus Woesearchaeota archaeon]
MRFFRKKEDKEESEEHNDLPPLKFPSEFPRYESEIGLSDEFHHPSPKPTPPPVSNGSSKLSEEDHPSFSTRPMTHQLGGHSKRQAEPNGKTLFVKIDNYKEAMRTMDKVKSKLADTEKVLNRLRDIKQEEDRELSSWHDEFEDLKEKLLSIDRELFEE